MEPYFPHLWIERKERKKCLAYTARATGIRVRYASKIDALVIDNINALISFLRKRYFFPVRCNLYFTDHERYHSQEDGHAYYGIFRDNEKAYPNRSIYPEIFVAAKLNLCTLSDDIAVADTGVDGGLTAAVAHGFDLLNAICQLHQPQAAGE